MFDASDFGLTVECSSSGRSNSYSLTKNLFHIIDPHGALFTQQVDISINANELFNLDIAMYFFLSLLSILIGVTVFFMVAYTLIGHKRIPFYEWEDNKEIEELM